MPITSPLCLIVPRLPPAIDGVGDYTFQLWKHWPDKDSRSWQCLVTEGAAESQAVLAELQVQQFEKSREGLEQALKAVGSKFIWLQYVGYGYDTQSQPFWLPETLRAWKQDNPDGRLAVMFHETWASGYPWQKVFWQSREQKKCAAQLLELSDYAVTSGMATERDLQVLRSGKQIHIIPISAGLTCCDLEIKNWRQLLVFGRAATRIRALQVHRNLLKFLSGRFVDQIVLAGESDWQDSDRKLLDSFKLSAEIVCAYDFPGDKLPRQVAACGLSLMQTPSNCLLKSSAFHLAAQMGQVPLVKLNGSPGKPLSELNYLGYRDNDFADIARQLGSKEALAGISEGLLVLAKGPLSWESIAASWSHLLGGS